MRLRILTSRALPHNLAPVGSQDAWSEKGKVGGKVGYNLLFQSLKQVSSPLPIKRNARDTGEKCQREVTH